VGKTLSFSEHVDLAAPVDEVFWFVCSSENAAKIDPSFVYWRPREWPPALGTHNDLKMKGPLGLPVKAVSRFSVWDPPHAMTLENVKPAWPIGVTAIHRFDERRGGGTSYTYTIELRPRRGGVLPARVMRSSMRRAVQKGARRLEELLGIPRG
jgi:hypothetical protein